MNESRFDLLPTRLKGLQIVGRKPLEDSRGFLERVFCRDDLAPLFGERSISQINRTLTQLQGSIRGLHFQYPPFAEAKLVSCLKGEVLDVAVDLRQGSPSFLEWHAEILSEENHLSLFIPEGFAHGFQTLQDGCELLYLHTAPYASEAEGGITPFDGRLGIHWPLTATEISERDRSHPEINEAFTGLDV